MKTPGPSSSSSISLLGTGKLPAASAHPEQEKQINGAALSILKSPAFWAYLLLAAAIAYPVALHVCRVEFTELHIGGIAAVSMMALLNLVEHGQLRSIGEVVLRTLRSPLFWTMALMAATIVYPHLYSVYDPKWQWLHISVVGTLALATLALIVHQRKALLFEVTLSKTIIMNKLFWERPWASPLLGGRLILSALPIASKREELLRFHPTCQLSFLEPHEVNRSGILFSSTPSLVADPSTQQLTIETEDFGAVSHEKMADGVIRINNILQNRGNLLVHCKGGVGRSASVVAAFLYQHGYKYDNVIAGIINQYPTVQERVDYILYYMKKVRPQMNLRGAQKQAIINYCNGIKHLLYVPSPAVITRYPTGHQLHLASDMPLPKINHGSSLDKA